MCLFFSPASVVDELLAIFVIFHYIKVAKHIWDQCGSRNWQLISHHTYKDFTYKEFTHSINKHNISCMFFYLLTAERNKLECLPQANLFFTIKLKCLPLRVGS
jgi:hypothetical protein